MSATLFILALDWAVRVIDFGGTIFYKSTQILVQVDNVIIVAKFVWKLKEIYGYLNDDTRSTSLEINCRTTKYMCMSTSKVYRISQIMDIDGDRFDGVSSFKYLEALVAL